MTTKSKVIHSDPEILGGTPVFKGTRVPIKNLIDYLEAGDSLDTFLEHFRFSRDRKQRYRCENSECKRRTFILNHSHPGRTKEVKEKIVEMSHNGSGIRDTARVLKVSTSTVIKELKKIPVHQNSK